MSHFQTMDSKSYDLSLPPLKRYKLLQNEAEIHPQNSPFHQFDDEKSNLPAKKRKLSATPPPPPPIYSLPAKKRIWATPPIDLNISPKLSKHFDQEEEEEDDDDDGIICGVCQSGDGDSEDPIVLCDGCDVMVHCSCYGHPLIKGVPEGDWFCDQCSRVSNCVVNDKKSRKSCCLCPLSSGPMKETKDGKWAHIVCALFIPEVFFEEPEGREGIDCSMVPRKRFEGVCYLCREKNGCVLDCSEQKCELSFHVTCGLNEDLYVEYQQGKKKSDVVAGFCRKHTDLWEKQQQTGKYKIVAKD